MKKFILFSAVILSSGAAQAEGMSYAERMQKLQELQHSRPNAENYLNSSRAASAAPVTIPARGKHFYVPVSINGQEVVMMADTGASSIFISQNMARRMGINMGTLDYNITYETANGKILAARTTAKSLKVGSIVMEDVPITVSQKADDDMALLGMEFFQRLSKYEVNNGVLTLYK